MNTRAAALLAALRGGAPEDGVLTKALQAVVKALNVKQALVLKADAAKRHLLVHGGIRDDLDAMIRELNIPLKATPSSGDIFSTSYLNAKDAWVDDAFSRRYTARLPARYYEVVGAPCFALLACKAKGLPLALLLIDADSPADLPTSERVDCMDPLREVVARASA